MAGKVTSKWTLDGDLERRLKKFPDQFDNVIGTYLDYQSSKVQDYMRSNAKWTDRSGNARQGLFAKYIKKKGTHSIVIYHTMSYGIFLETRWDGKYAIIEPTLLHYGPILMAGSRDLIGEMT